MPPSTVFYSVQCGDFCFFVVYKDNMIDIMLLPKGKKSDFSNQKETMELFNKRNIPHLVIGMKTGSFHYYKWNDSYKKEVIHHVNKGDYFSYECDNCGKCETCQENLRLLAKEVCGVSASLLQIYFMSDSYKKVNNWGSMSVYGCLLKSQEIYKEIWNGNLVSKAIQFVK